MHGYHMKKYFRLKIRFKCKIWHLLSIFECVDWCYKWLTKIKKNILRLSVMKRKKKRKIKTKQSLNEWMWHDVQTLSGTRNRVFVCVMCFHCNLNTIFAFSVCMFSQLIHLYFYFNHFLGLFLSFFVVVYFMPHPNSTDGTCENAITTKHIAINNDTAADTKSIYLSICIQQDAVIFILHTKRTERALRRSQCRSTCRIFWALNCIHKHTIYEILRKYVVFSVRIN